MGGRTAGAIPDEARPGEAGEVGVESARPTLADQHGLEDAVPAHRRQVVGMQNRLGRIEHGTVQGHHHA